MAAEEILLDLVPLESMPHTVRTVLNLAARGLLNGGTFFLARDHILVGGPVDAGDTVRNDRMSQRLAAEGYFPDGALLFKEDAGDACDHAQHTVGFNQLGGPEFYINLLDNTANHGPRRLADGTIREGDPCFARVVAGVDVVDRIVAMKDARDDSLAGVYIVNVEVVDFPF